MGSRIQTIASIIFALLFIAILSVMNSSVLQFGSAVDNKVGNTVSISENYELNSFDGRRVSGDTVISAINNKDTLNSRYVLSITVDGVPVTGSYADSGLTINPNDVYQAELQYNANDVVEGIIFTQTTP